MTDRDFLERAQSFTEKSTGEAITDQGFADAFGMFGLQRRVDALDTFEQEMQNDDMPLRRRARLMSLHRKLKNVHETLRDAGR